MVESYDCKVCYREYISGYIGDDKMAWFGDHTGFLCEICHNISLMIHEQIEKDKRNIKQHKCPVYWKHKKTGHIVQDGDLVPIMEHDQYEKIK
jgi:hypothetical protein